MEADPILKEVHAMKDQLAREVDYDIHALCERIRRMEGQYSARLVRPLPEKETGAPAVSRT